jgi:hypothetical protein
MNKEYEFRVKIKPIDDYDGAFVEFKKEGMAVYQRHVWVKDGHEEKEKWIPTLPYLYTTRKAQVEEHT